MRENATVKKDFRELSFTEIVKSSALQSTDHYYFLLLRINLENSPSQKSFKMLFSVVLLSMYGYEMP